MLSEEKLFTDKNMTADEKKVMYKKYLQLELKFFQWLQVVTSELFIYDIDTEVLTSNIISSKPKINKLQIRTIRRFSSSANQKRFLRDFEELKSYFFAVFPERKREPVYFPKFFQSADQITITTHEAHATKRVEKKDADYFQDFFSFRVESPDDEKGYEKYIDDMDKLGYRYEAVIKERRAFFKVNVLDIMEKNGAEVITIKRKSGNQFQCRIKEPGKSKTKLTQFGFILLGTEADPSIYRTENPGIRSDRMEREANIIQFPVFIAGKTKMVPYIKFYKSR